MSEHAPTTDGDEQTTIEAEPHEVLDPEDYNQNRRLKAIHKAREDVRRALRKVSQQDTGKGWDLAHDGLADAVAAYGYEVLPIAKEVGYEFDDPHFDRFVWETTEAFIRSMGTVPTDEDYPHTHPMRYHSMAVYHSINKFVREVGLGADLDDETDEWEIET